VSPEFENIGGTMNKQIDLLNDLCMKPEVIVTKKGKIEVDITKGDLPAILFSHGGMGGYDQGRAALSFLDENKYKLICPSRPGYLQTPLESGKTLEEQADLFAALLDKLGIEKVAVVTVSAGGPPGYTFAIRHPDRIRALIAIDSVSGFYEIPETVGPISEVILLSNLGQKILKKIAEFKPEISLKEVFSTEALFTKNQMKKHMDHVLNTPKKLEFLQAFLATMNPYKDRKIGTNNDLELYLQLTHLPFEKIQCSTLIVHGTHDADVKFYDGVYAYETIANAQRFWIEEGSHLGFWLSPNSEKAQKVVNDFLDKHCK